MCLCSSLAQVRVPIHGHERGRSFVMRCWGDSHSPVCCWAAAGMLVGGLLHVQTVVELFLGLRLKTYFPSARLPYTDSLPKGEGSDSEDSDADDPSLSVVWKVTPFLFLGGCGNTSLAYWLCCHSVPTAQQIALPHAAAQSSMHEHEHVLAVLCALQRQGGKPPCQCLLAAPGRHTKDFMCLQTGLERDLVNQHTVLEAATGMPGQKEVAMPWQQLASELGHILDPLTLSDLTSAS